MAIKVIFARVCDGPEHRGRDVPAESLPPIPVGRKGPRVIELCADHRTNLTFDEVYALYEKYGHDPDDGDDVPAAPKDRPRLQCPKCSYSVGTRSSLREHLLREHDTTLAEAETELGRTVEGQELVESCDFCHLRFASGQAKGQHESRDHPEEHARKIAAAEAGETAPVVEVEATKTAKKAPAKRVRKSA